MRPGAGVRGSLGAAFVLLAFAGAAGADAASAPRPGPRCEAASAPKAPEGMAALMESVRRDAARRPQGASAIVPLDNRGYAYPAAPAPLELPARPAGR